MSIADFLNVEYREVPKHPGYWVASDGTVWSDRGRRSKAWYQIGTKSSCGYYYVILTWRPVLVHRLILEIFVGPCPEGMCACHFDDDPKNNALSNLRWGTPQDNTDDKIRNNQQPRGSSHCKAKLTENDVMVLRAAYQNGENISAHARRLGISCSAAHAAAQGTNWKHLPKVASQ